MVKINGGSIEPDEHSLSLKAGKDGNSASLGDMCLVSLATDKGDTVDTFVRDGLQEGVINPCLQPSESSPLDAPLDRFPQSLYSTEYSTSAQ
jgi:hypothetical protein